jgi:amidohydrolase
MHPLYAEALHLFETTRSWRRDFHQHPELGLQEVRTAGIVAAELRALGLEVITGMAETGVTALLAGDHPGPTILLRFDMDALPIEEETGAPYASLNPGRMHACGHDGHVATGLSVARLLQAHRHEMHGAVQLVFQPGEEGLNGADRMIQDGVLEHFHPEHALALHLWNDRPVGWLGISSGPVMAGSAIFTVTLDGRGGHAASPHQTVDPLAAAAQVVTALQSIVARNLPPLEAGVVSVCQLRAGDAFNVIPSTAELAGTLRWFTPRVKEILCSRFEQIVRQTAAAMGCEAAIEITPLTPPVVNDPALTRRVQATARQVWPEAEIETAYQTMGSEDMAFFNDRLPGCFFFVGSADPARGLAFAHHHPRFDFDETALPCAAALLSAAALDLLAEA